MDELDDNIKNKDPIKILKDIIIKRNILSENDLNHLIDQSEIKIKKILTDIRRDNLPKPQDFKKFLYN